MQAGSKVTAMLKPPPPTRLRDLAGDQGQRHPACTGGLNIGGGAPGGPWGEERPREGQDRHRLWDTGGRRGRRRTQCVGGGSWGAVGWC